MKNYTIVDFNRKNRIYGNDANKILCSSSNDTASLSIFSEKNIFVI